MDYNWSIWHRYLCILSQTSIYSLLYIEALWYNSQQVSNSILWCDEPVKLNLTCRGYDLNINFTLNVLFTVINNTTWTL